MPGSKSIRVFNQWFAMDSKSQLREGDICSDMAGKITSNDGWEWDSEKKCFWLKEKNVYYNHACETCKKNFNYPVSVEVCPVCSDKVSKCKAVWVGRVEPPSEREWDNSQNKRGEVDPTLVQRAKEDLAKNPVKEEGFDWQHLRDNI